MVEHPLCLNVRHHNAFEALSEPLDLVTETFRTQQQEGPTSGEFHLYC